MCYANTHTDAEKYSFDSGVNLQINDLDDGFQEIVGRKKRLKRKEGQNSPDRNTVDMGKSVAMLRRGFEPPSRK